MGPMLKTWFDSLPQAEVDCFNPEFETADLFLPWEGDQEVTENLSEPKVFTTESVGCHSTHCSDLACWTLGIHT
jgi:hypothetical protein